MPSLVCAGASGLLMGACPSLSTQTMVYVIHEIPIFIAMGVVGKNGCGLRPGPAAGATEAQAPTLLAVPGSGGRPPWGTELPLAGDSSPAFSLSSWVGPSSSGIPSGPLPLGSLP